MSQDGFYKEAALILEAVRGGKGRIKSLCYNSKHRNKQGLFALVSEALKQYDLLEQTLEKAAFFKLEKHAIRPSLVMVLLYDLVHDRPPQCSAKLWDSINRNKTRLKAEYVRLKMKLGPLSAGFKPWRYARINRIRATLADCVSELCKLGFSFSKEEAYPTDVKGFVLDPHVSDLLVFWPGTDLTQTKLYKSGQLILQDKASCMPVEVLKPPPGAVVIDTCAAPGNKTTQLAAAVGQEGRIYAFERDPKRADILRSTLAKHAPPGMVKVANMDFLRVNPANYPEVTFALVDPSCSGSGIFEDYELARKAGIDATFTERLRSLSNFQCMIIRHAMKFPNLKKIVYSTCSVHREENEEVVKQILELEPNFALVKNPLPLWHRRGLEEYPFYQDVIRANPVEDRMNGFFIACFEKKKC